MEVSEVTNALARARIMGLAHRRRVERTDVTPTRTSSLPATSSPPTGSSSSQTESSTVTTGVIANR